ncbi:hypothetical protein KIJ05_03350 [Leuconostoc gelidum subsp. gasicomitatum]|uniref:hypothetical protein n=1 Tax=Leuconostoc gasicomitatum TaxID=115778 RepID=UPI001CC66CEC|nr:hypothetical protein [Leuconostoc gasicomitatum]MBZ5984171.1 hypothetical protein [Leuconostoc gasicomitatum]
MTQKIWLKPEQLENYIAQLQGFRTTYQSLLSILASGRQNFEFKPGAPNFQNTLQMSMKLHRYIHSVQSQTFEYRDLTNLLNGHDVNSESGINLIEAKLKQAKKQLYEISR